MTTGMTLFALAITLGVFPWARTHLVTANLWRLVKPQVRPDMKLLVVGFSEPSIVWEFRQGITNYVQFLRSDSMAEALHGEARSCLVLPTELFDQNRAQISSATTVTGVQGVDTAGFKFWDLTAVIRQ